MRPAQAGKSGAPRKHRHHEVAPRKSVSVAILCHNYGRFLREAIDSVLAQKHRATEIIVFDDASSDETSTVARAYASRGVSYIRLENNCSLKTRRDAVACTSGRFFMFLDADDAIAEDYLKCGLELFSDSRVALVYSDMVHFGNVHKIRVMPARCDCDSLSRTNYIHNGALISREAYLQHDMFANIGDAQLHQDWRLFKSLMSHGWLAMKQPAMYYYRIHGDNRTLTYPQESYWMTSAMVDQHIDLFIPLSGRKDTLDRLLGWLDSQEWPHEQVSLILMDTSQDDDFSYRVQHWMADNNYGDCRYLKMNVGNKDLADEPRTKENSLEVSLAMCRIYNRMLQMVTAPYVMIVEDDVIPPLNAVEKLLKEFMPNVASVSAMYPSRHDGKACAWNADSRRAVQNKVVQDVHGNGFGCVIIRRSALVSQRFTCVYPRSSFDHVFYERMPRRERRLLCWKVKCEHLAYKRE